MSPIVIAIGVAVLCATVAIFIKYRRTRTEREMERRSLTPDELHTLLASNQVLVVFDVRQPLDLLADSEIILGAKRLAPKEVEENPSLIPNDQDSVVYCTCPSDETSRRILRQSIELGLERVRLLRGGLGGWKAKGYPVEPYEASFRLDVRS